MEDVIEIYDICGYIEHVKKEKPNTLYESVNSMTWYRGQSDYAWTLIPSVYREGNFKNETVYIKEFERVRPSEFRFDSSFDKLVKMQHYGLPTRLLDITTNPLVALYFACESKAYATCDGAVYIVQAPTFWQDAWSLQVVMNYIFHPESCVEDIVEASIPYVPNVFLKDSEKEIEHLVLNRLTVPAYFVIPKLTNQRIVQQNGGFMVFGMTIEERKTSRDAGTFGREYLTFNALPRDFDGFAPTMKKLKISAANKKNILAELELLNIHEAYLFPELEYQAKHIIKTIV